MLILIGLVTLLARLAVLPCSTELNMDADAPHFMNVARCFERGQGFSNPAAWPTWMKPERLPMPETFKEPAYPWMISKLTPLTKSPFRAGQTISFLAGLFTPFFTWMLMRRLRPQRAVADLAALMVAVSPLLIAYSARVMVESVYTAVFTLLWVTLVPRPGGIGRGRRALDLAVDAAAGVLLGFAFMLRAQTLLAAPAVAVQLFMRGDSIAATLRRAAVVFAAAVLTASPFLLRNLRLFGTPLYSDVAAFGLMPYSDYYAVWGHLERPSVPFDWVLHHFPQVLGQIAISAVIFAGSTLPQMILGNPAWTVPLAAGVLLSLSCWRKWLFLYVYVGLTIMVIFTIKWVDRYFASTVPLWCAITAPGALWLAGALDRAPLVGRLRGRHLLVGTLVALVALQAAAAREDVRKQFAPENAAARAESSFLRTHLAPDEAVMVLTTSYYAYWSDRPAVFVVLADSTGFMGEMRRLKVRYAALPTSALAGLATRYPGGRLPAALVFDHANEASDVTVFRIVDRAAPSVPGHGPRPTTTR